MRVATELWSDGGGQRFIGVQETGNAKLHLTADNRSRISSISAQSLMEFSRFLDRSDIRNKPKKKKQLPTSRRRRMRQIQATECCHSAGAAVTPAGGIY